MTTLPSVMLCCFQCPSEQKFEVVRASSSILQKYLAIFFNKRLIIEYLMYIHKIYSLIASFLIVIMLGVGSMPRPASGQEPFIPSTCPFYDPNCGDPCPIEDPWCQITIFFTEATLSKEDPSNSTSTTTTIIGSSRVKEPLVDLINNTTRDNLPNATVIIRNQFSNTTLNTTQSMLGNMTVNQIENITSTIDLDQITMNMSEKEFLDITAIRTCYIENNTCDATAISITPILTTFGAPKPPELPDVVLASGPWALLVPGMYATCIFASAAGWVAGDGTVSDIPWDDVKNNCNPFAQRLDGLYEPAGATNVAAPVQTTAVVVVVACVQTVWPQSGLLSCDLLTRRICTPAAAMNEAY